MKRRLRILAFGFLSLFGLLALGGSMYLHLPKFGALPDGARLERIRQSPHYIDGAFQNLVSVPQPANTGGAVSGLVNYLLAKKERPTPPVSVPSVKTDLSGLDRQEDVVIWLGHASYFIQLGGKRILIDPVFSANAAPVPFANRAFAGTSLYTADDMPDIDYLLLSHDHWDHLDYPTVTALQAKVKKVVCGLGVGAHLARWGFAEDSIHEGDWNSKLELEDDFIIHVLPARHYSGRSLTRNQTLWVAFALTTPKRRVFFSGDSGYGPHFREIGQAFGSFDLALLDTGQYNEGWRYTHMMPEDAVQAAEDLQARALLPAHIGKFSIAYHAWDDPMKRIAAASHGKSYRLLTPMIGEPVVFNDKPQTFSRWWENMQYAGI